MEGASHFFPVLSVLVGGLIIAIMTFVLLGVSRYLRREKRKVVCPVHHEAYDAEVVFDEEGERYTGVLACTHFTPAEAVHCHRDCVRDLNRAPPVQLS